MKRCLLALIKGYQFIGSPWVGRYCRFMPSCSVYTAEAIEKYGAGKGAYLGFKRICRCQPFSHGGYDPVP